jgi:hypothetical protein
MFSQALFMPLLSFYVLLSWKALILRKSLSWIITFLHSKCIHIQNNYIIPETSGNYLYHPITKKLYSLNCWFYCVLYKKPCFQLIIFISVSIKKCNPLLPHPQNCYLWFRIIMEYKNIHKLSSKDKVLHLKKKNCCWKSHFGKISFLRILWLFSLINDLSRLLNFTLNMGYVNHSLPCGGGLYCKLWENYLFVGGVY